MGTNLVLNTALERIDELVGRIRNEHQNISLYTNLFDLVERSLPLLSEAKYDDGITSGILGKGYLVVYGDFEGDKHLMVTDVRNIMKNPIAYRFIVRRFESYVGYVEIGIWDSVAGETSTIYKKDFCGDE